MRTVSVRDVSTIAMVNGNERKFDRVIHGGVVKEWVGIGWIETGEPTAEELETLPHVVEED